MALRSIRHTQWLALLGACVSSACSGSKPPVPDTFVNAFVTQSASGGTCNVGSDTTILAVGAATGTAPTTVKNGGSENGSGTVTVTCSVVASGSGFDIKLDAEQLGGGGGNLTISSPSGKGAVTESGGTVQASFTNVTTAGGSYSESDCTLTYTYGGSPVPTQPFVAPGRIWGHVSCPMAAQNGTSSVCDAEADFFFENCSQ